MLGKLGDYYIDYATEDDIEAIHNLALPLVIDPLASDELNTTTRLFLKEFTEYSVKRKTAVVVKDIETNQLQSAATGINDNWITTFAVNHKGIPTLLLSKTVLCDFHTIELPTKFKPMNKYLFSSPLKFFGGLPFEKVSSRILSITPSHKKILLEKFLKLEQRYNR